MAEPRTRDFGITKGTLKALVQSLRARTASLISLERMPRSISGGSMEGSHPSPGAGCDTATCMYFKGRRPKEVEGWPDTAGSHLNCASEKLSCFTVCCQLSSLPLDVIFRKLLQQTPCLIDTHAYMLRRRWLCMFLVYTTTGSLHSAPFCDLQQGAACNLLLRLWYRWHARLLRRFLPQGGSEQSKGW